MEPTRKDCFGNDIKVGGLAVFADNYRNCLNIITISKFTNKGLRYFIVKDSDSPDPRSRDYQYDYTTYSERGWSFGDKEDNLFGYMESKIIMLTPQDLDEPTVEAYKQLLEDQNIPCPYDIL